MDLEASRLLPAWRSVPAPADSRVDGEYRRALCAAHAAGTHASPTIGSGSTADPYGGPGADAAGRDRIGGSADAAGRRVEACLPLVHDRSRAAVRSARSGTIELVVVSDTTADVIAVPLSHDDEPTGVLLVAAAAGRRFDDAQVGLIGALREPFAAALQNDRRIHEMARLREAAEADRGALLRRLGAPICRTESSVKTPVCGT